MQYFIDHTDFPLYLVLCILEQYCVCLLFLLSCIISDWYLEKKQKNITLFMGKTSKPNKHKFLEVGWDGVWICVSCNAGCKVNIDVLVSIPLQGSWKILLAYFYLETEKSVEQQCNNINLLLLSIHDRRLEGTWGSHTWVI